MDDFLVGLMVVAVAATTATNALGVLYWWIADRPAKTGLQK